MKKTLVSGVQATGELHIGNYFGALRQFVSLQDEYDAYVFVANYHSLTTIQNKEILEKLTRQVVLDYLAVGLDPKKATIYLQSDLPEVTEATWIFNSLITVPYLSRAHAYKDKTAKGIEASVGLFDYPVLMAADILLPNADVVPVGADQKQHVEITRDIAEKFNSIYGETFTVPNPLILENVATVPGTDGQKMSKSYSNTIPLFGSDAEIEKAIMGIVTDSKSPEEAKNPDECNVFALHKLMTPEPKLSEIRAGYEKGGLSYAESKKMLIQSYHAMFDEMRDRRRELEKDENYIKEVLTEGKSKARDRTEPKMAEIRGKVGLKLLT